jgi:uncharacterized protein (TIGR00730 family)
MSQRPDRVPHVAVFGSSQAGSNGSLGALAYALGRDLVFAGFGVISGGYGGIMEAVSHGAHDAGGRPIGITLATFDRRNLRANPWVAIEHKADTYLERIAELTRQASGFVALKGGIGTLSEVSITWSLLQVGELHKKPLVLLGDCWEPYLELVRGCFLLRPSDLGMVHLADSVEDTVQFLSQKLRSG